jgi:hypothetical protein
MILELLQDLLGKLETLDQGSVFLFREWYNYRYKGKDVEALPEQDIRDCIKVAAKLGAL